MTSLVIWSFPSSSDGKRRTFPSCNGSAEAVKQDTKILEIVQVDWPRAKPSSTDEMTVLWQSIVVHATTHVDSRLSTARPRYTLTYSMSCTLELAESVERNLADPLASSFPGRGVGIRLPWHRWSQATFSPRTQRPHARSGEPGDMNYSGESSTTRNDAVVADECHASEQCCVVVSSMRMGGGRRNSVAITICAHCCSYSHH